MRAEHEHIWLAVTAYERSTTPGYNSVVRRDRERSIIDLAHSIIIIFVVVVVVVFHKELI